MQGNLLEKLQAFLRSCQLKYDSAIRFTAALVEDDEIIAAGSLDGNIIKCVAVSPAHQGEDLTAQILTVLMQKAAQDGVRRLMLYTKPQNGYLFRALGFHEVVRTSDCLLMENSRDGLSAFLAALPKPEGEPVGCIVAHCNPFTLGHRWLIETAARECAWVHVFILSEDRGLFSPDLRLQMARAGCADLPNVLIHPSGPYMVSSATFPTYFLKDQARTGDIHCELDVRLFGERIAPALRITRRYVGTEPLCAVTSAYNAHMKQLLPACGVELIELERKTAGEACISASRVRSLLASGQRDALCALLPQTTIDLISEEDLPCRIPTECRKA